MDCRLRFKRLESETVSDVDHAAFFWLGRINTSAEMPRRSCRRRIIAIERPRFRFRTSAIRVSGTDDRLQISAREPLLLHAEFDRLDRVGRIDWVVIAFIGVDQDSKHIEPVSVWSARAGTPQPLDLHESRLVIRLASDRLDFTHD